MACGVRRTAYGVIVRGAARGVVVRVARGDRRMA